MQAKPMRCMTDQQQKPMTTRRTSLMRTAAEGIAAAGSLLTKRRYNLGIDHTFYGAIEPAKDQPEYIKERIRITWQTQSNLLCKPKSFIAAG